MKIAGSFLKSNYDTKTTVSKLDESNIDYIHVDFMDGKFVKMKTFTMGEVIKLLGKVKKPLDVHLMTINPLKYLEGFATLNTEYFTFHYEAVSDVLETINKVKYLGIKVGMSIKPKTSVNKIKEYLPYLDQILIMSVAPGKGGQEFITSSIIKVEQLLKLRKENNYTYIISVDGGINDNTIDLVRDADMIVAGSFICESDNFNKRIDLLK